jgi:REP-associated tyrosine transposase
VRTRYRINSPDLPHFVTSTVVEWLPIFTSEAYCDILVRSLLYCRHHKGLKIYAWVILDNHIHAILAAPKLSRAIADFKKFTAHELLAKLEAEGRDWLLNQLRFYRAKHKGISDHQVWQEGVHPQSIPSDAIMFQKLQYLHNNPVKRGLVASPEHWRYSSAHEWAKGAEPLFRCDDWRQPR